MLVSADELRAYMNYTPEDDSELIVMDAVLKRTQKAVETLINRPVERVQVREVVRSDSKGLLYLRVTPVWKLISCGGTSAPSPISDTTPTYTVIADEDLPEGGRIWDFGPVNNAGTNLVPGRLFVGAPNTWFGVEYIGGLADNIDDIKQIVLAASARIWAQNNVTAAGLEQGQVEQIGLGDSRVPWISEDERQSLQRYRRRVIR